MKKLSFFFFIFLLFAACEKEESSARDNNTSSNTETPIVSPDTPDNPLDFDPLDFDFYYSFDPENITNAIAFRGDDGRYERYLGLLFGVPYSLYSRRGITEFAIGIYCDEGKISTNTGWIENNTIYVTKEGSIVWYTGHILNDRPHQWDTLLQIVNMSNPNIKLTWMYRVKCNNEYYSFGWETATFAYSQIENM